MRVCVTHAHSVVKTSMNSRVVGHGGNTQRPCRTRAKGGGAGAASAAPCTSPPHVRTDRQASTGAHEHTETGLHTAPQVGPGPNLPRDHAEGVQRRQDNGGGAGQGIAVRQALLHEPHPHGEAQAGQLRDTQHGHCRGTRGQEKHAWGRHGWRGGRGGRGGGEGMTHNPHSYAAPAAPPMRLCERMCGPRARLQNKALFPPAQPWGRVAPPPSHRTRGRWEPAIGDPPCSHPPPCVRASRGTGQHQCRRPLPPPAAPPPPQSLTGL